MAYRIKLGQKVKDMVTGMEGVAVGRIKYMCGCDRYIVQPPLDSHGCIPEEVNFDEPQLVVIDRKAIVLVGAEPDLGGPRDRQAPGRKMAQGAR